MSVKKLTYLLSSSLVHYGICEQIPNAANGRPKSIKRRILCYNGHIRDNLLQICTVFVMSFL